MRELNQPEGVLLAWIRFAVLETTVVLIKSAFCAAWVIVVWALHEYVIERFVVDAWIPWVLTHAFEAVFDGATLVEVLRFVLRTRLSA